MKTEEELNALKEELEALNKKLADLTEEELAQVNGGCDSDLYTPFTDILWTIEQGDAEGAKRKFKIYSRVMSEGQIESVRAHFKLKFGYPID